MVVDKKSSTHPPLPPTTEDERLSWLRLLRSRRVGPGTFWRLLAEHGSAAAALDALPDLARSSGVRGYDPFPKHLAEQELDRGSAAGARLVIARDPAYPAALRDLPDPPPLLWLLGREDLLQRSCIALVGSREGSSLGLRMARGLAADLGRAGHVIVSGLARGIDAAAHDAALPCGTVAVMPGGVDLAYPNENKTLHDRIRAEGLCLSEQPPGLAPLARHFPLRNRLVSGLSRAVVVVEAEAKSGTLITARHALDQGRDVLAVPGHPLDPRSAGCNMLLRDGAALVRSARDILEALGEPTEIPPKITELAEPPAAFSPPPRPDPPRRPLREVARLHRMILDRLARSPLEEEALLRDLDAPSRQVSPVLTDLELDGRIERRPGGLIRRTR